jgi:ankyrin repeat protein
VQRSAQRPPNNRHRDCTYSGGWIQRTLPTFLSRTIPNELLTHALHFQRCCTPAVTASLSAFLQSDIGLNRYAFKTVSFTASINAATSAIMGLSELPNEIILDIVDYLDRQQHIHAVALSNWRFYRLLRDRMFRFNIRNRGSSALISIASRGRLETAHKLLRLGADINTRGEFPYEETPLYAAVSNGHLSLVKMLLKMGANPAAGHINGRTPLYAALTSRNEDIASILLDATDDVDVSIAATEHDQTPLHTACLLHLLRSVRYLLDRGADANKTTMGMDTPLCLALTTRFGLPKGPCYDDVLSIVLLLLRSGAEPSEEACALGVNHPDPRIRGIFQRDGIGVRKTDRVIIGRLWHALNSGNASSQLDDNIPINWNRLVLIKYV